MKTSLSLPLLLSYLLLFIHLSSYANSQHSAQLNETQSAIESFQNDTQEILTQARKLNRQHGGHLERLNQMLAETKSAIAVLQSDLIKQLEQDATQMLQLTEAYLNYYRTFVYSISQDSSCYQPEQIDTFELTLIELQHYVDNIQTLASTPDEESAFAALMEINVEQTRVAMTVNLFEMFKLCYITEAVAPLSEQFNTLETQLTELAIQHGATPNNEIDDEFFVDDNLIQTELKHQSEIISTYEFMAGEVVNVNQLTYLHFDKLSQLSHLTLSNGLKIDQALNLQLPPNVAGNNEHLYSASITGRVETLDDIAQLNITIKRNPVLSIAKILFSDKNIAACIEQSAQISQFTQAHQMELLSCELPRETSTKLNDLINFKQLTMISLKGGTIESLAPLAKLDSLETLYLSDIKLKEFGDLSSFNGSINLNQIDTQDWSKLAQTRANPLSINKPENCSELTPLFSHSNVAVLYKDMGSTEQVGAMEQVDSGAKTVMVITDCAKP